MSFFEILPPSVLFFALGFAAAALRSDLSVPDALAKLTITCAYNDLEAVERIAREVPLAAIMLEWYAK